MPGTYLQKLEKLLLDEQDAQIAEKMSVYLRDQFEFIGVKTPRRKEILKEYLAENGIPEMTEAEKFAIDAMRSGYRELHYCGIEVFGRTHRSWSLESIEKLEEMTRTNSWWDTVDSININCLRRYFKKFPETMDSKSLEWANSDNFWFQRLSLICQLRRKNQMDLSIVERNIAILIESDEFFVQKAIGWILRDYAHSNPEWVIDYVEKHPLKPLSRREALKNINK